MVHAFTSLAPTPKLIVDVGASSSTIEKISDLLSNSASGSDPQGDTDNRAATLLALLTESMPPDSSSGSFSNFLPGFISLRMLLLKSTHTDFEKDLIRILWDSYNSYLAANRSATDIASLLAMDCLFLTQQQPGMPPLPSLQQQQHQQQEFLAINNSFNALGLATPNVMLQQNQPNLQHLPQASASESYMFPFMSYMHYPP
jgi:hypothetical protein